tara:strand:- start:1019 stop:1384 length:366 start_codon:yes stop_codon:yes gene_type:complete
MTIPIKLIMILATVESGQNPRAVGDDLKSLGILQMQEAYVQDAAEYANKPWVHEDALDELTSIKIFRAYMERYATEERLGRPVTFEDIARIHNGGPNGYKKKSTIKYWEKVKCLMEKQKYL